MRALIDVAAARPFTLAGPDSGSPGVEGMLIEGPQGWGEFSPRSVGEDSRAFVAATEAGTVGWPDPIRGRIPVAITLTTTDPDVAAERVAATGAGTVRVPVGGCPRTVEDDRARLRAARAAVGAHGAVRLVLGSARVAPSGPAALFDDAGGVQLVEVVGGAPGDIAALRRAIGVPVAVPVAGAEPHELAGYADIAVLSVPALGGVRRALRLAELAGLPALVNSPGESSLGIAAGLALAGALAELPFACGLGDLPLLDGDLVDPLRSLVPSDGSLPVAPMPPAPEAALLDRHRITDAALVARWRERLRRVAG